MLNESGPEEYLRFCGQNVTFFYSVSLPRLKKSGSIVILNNKLRKCVPGGCVQEPEPGSIRGGDKYWKRVAPCSMGGLQTPVNFSNKIGMHRLTKSLGIWRVSLIKIWL